MTFVRLALAVLLAAPAASSRAQDPAPPDEAPSPLKALELMPALKALEAMPPLATAAEATLAPEAPAAAPVAASAPSRSSSSAAPSKATASAGTKPVVNVSGAGGTGAILPVLPGAPSEERILLDKITTLNTIKQQEYAQRVRKLTEERDEEALKNSLMAEKVRAELAPLERDQKKQQIRGQIEDEKSVQAIAALRYQRDRLKLENDLSRERLAAETIKADADKLRTDLQIRELDFQSRKLRQEADIAANKTVAIKADLDLRDKKDSWNKQANREPDYEKEPFKNGVLTVTDRRIEIDGAIVYGSADYVTERIHYYNNKSEEYPIFIVIGRSPGGAVMEGYRILKAMQASKAPVHVIVKSYAASMAATIATLAPHSYAYPNAVILHHQMWSVLFGNPTQQKQQLDVQKEWDRRLREPIARKMGTSLEKFTAEMYKRNVDGDWEEFADAAVKLKWIDHVVNEIRETGIVKEPDAKSDEKPKLLFGLSEETDSKGDRFVRLPKLQHSDAYFLYNRDGYYR